MTPFQQNIVIGIVFLILAASIFLSYIVYYDPDVRMTEPFSSGSIEDVQSNKCDPNTISNICQNSSSCCAITSNSSVNGNSYFCNHPLIKNCTSELQNCLDKTDFDNLYPVELRREKCKKQLADCCAPFDKIATDPTKFQNMGTKVFQKTDMIGNYLALDATQRQVCPKMCQTDSSCAAFSIDSSGCKFFSSSNPVIPPLGGDTQIDSTNQKGYFQKH